MEHMLDGGGYAAFGVRARKLPSTPAQLFRCISHDKGVASKGKHLNIIIVITDGHDLIAGNAPVISPALQRVSFGAVGSEHIDYREVAAGVFGAENGDR